MQLKAQSMYKGQKTSKFGGKRVGQHHQTPKEGNCKCRI